MQARNRKAVLGTALAIFVAAAALRAAPLLLHRLEPARITTVDSGRYLELADRLAAGDGFQSRQWRGRLGPELFRTPGYPLVLALAGKLPGSRHAWVIGLQILAGAATVALCYVLVSAWASPRAGIFAAALLALDPAHVVYSNLVMSDVLCGASIAAGLVLLEHARGSPAPGHATAEWWRLAFAGCLLSVATALRPVAVLLVVPAAIYLRRRDGSRAGVASSPRRVAAFAVAAFATAALLFPLGWTARNGLTTGSWTLSTAFDINLALVVAAKTEARAGRLARSAAEQRVMTRVAEVEDRADPPPGERASGLTFHRACRTVALEALLLSPRAAITEAAASAAEMLLAGERRYMLQVLGLSAGEGRESRPVADPWRGLASYSRADRLVVFGQAAFMAAVWILAAAGIVALWRRGRTDVALFALFALAVVLFPSLVVGTGRMRLPVAILIHGLAGIGYDSGFFHRRPANRAKSPSAL